MTFRCEKLPGRKCNALNTTQKACQILTLAFLGLAQYADVMEHRLKNGKVGTIVCSVGESQYGKTKHEGQAALLVQAPAIANPMAFRASIRASIYRRATPAMESDLVALDDE